MRDPIDKAALENLFETLYDNDLATEIWMNSNTVRDVKNLPTEKLQQSDGYKLIYGLMVKIDDSLPDRFMETDLQRRERLNKLQEQS